MSLIAVVIVNLCSRFAEVPSSPGCPEFLKTGEDAVVITWQPPESNGGSAVLDYVVEKREIRGPRCIRVQKSVVASPPFTVSGLSGGCEYEFRVFARNAIGLSESSPASKSMIFAQPGES